MERVPLCRLLLAVFVYLVYRTRLLVSRIENDRQDLGVIWGRVKKYNSFANKEKQIWVIRGKKIKAEENNRKRPSLV